LAKPSNTDDDDEDIAKEEKPTERQEEVQTNDLPQAPKAAELMRGKIKRL
jgi:hypothetical protein